MEMLTIFERRIEMKTLTAILLVLFMALWIFVAGCQNHQARGYGQKEKVDNVVWRDTGTGFYRPDYSQQK